MKEIRRFNMNRRTFIITTAGLVITHKFVGRLSPSHAADPPAALEFKATVARWVAIDQSGAMDSAQQGQITITPAGGSAAIFPIVDGGVSFSIPNNVTSQIVVQVGDMAHRTWEASFDSGTLVIKNKDYADTPLVYHWMAPDNCYVLEYWQDSLYITGPADPGGYFIGYLYAPLNPLESAGRLPLGQKQNAAQPLHEPPPPTNPPDDDDPGANWILGMMGIPADNNGVSTGSILLDPAAEWDRLWSMCTSFCLGGSSHPVKKNKPRAGETVSPDEIRMPIAPSLAALEQNQASPRLDNINFGMVVNIQDQSGNDLGTTFVGLNQETEVAGGITMTLTHLLSYPIDQIVITMSLPLDLLNGMGLGAYKMTFWIQTTDGLSSNKRFEYVAITEGEAA